MIECNDFNNTSNVADTAKRTEWHWPVPLFFAGLTATLVLVAFSLAILACSYGKTIDSHSNVQSLNASGELGMETDGACEDIEEEKMTVIMVEQHNPTL